ncbi:MAG: hypothetical protein HYY30_12370 [Chloroflexi bacterium]|nr:hypothetical protein [Chloroflexota bacterium]
MCYLQRNDADAVRYAGQATELDPKLSEAFFNHAKFTAAAGQADVAVWSLERAIRDDRRYAARAGSDPDFQRVETAVTALMERLRAEARAEAEAGLRLLSEGLARHHMPKCPERAQIDELHTKAVAASRKNTYFGYLDAIDLASRSRRALDALRLPDRDKIASWALEVADRLRGQSQPYWYPLHVQPMVEGALTGLEAAKLENATL